jgi:hypothetical protein
MIEQVLQGLAWGPGADCALVVPAHEQQDTIATLVGQGGKYHGAKNAPDLTSVTT